MRMTTHVRPNRWLHVRVQTPFRDDLWALFVGNTRIFRAYVQAVLLEWPLVAKRAGQPTPPTLLYSFFEPSLSNDRRVATLPLGGDYILLSRLYFENASAR